MLLLIDSGYLKLNERGYVMMDNNITQIAVTGGSGFIGRALIGRLMKRPDVHVNVLVRNRVDRSDRANVRYVEGDLLKAETLRKLVVPGSIVINLAYLLQESFEVNREAVYNLLDVCERNKIRRLVHCSTAAVLGKSRDDVVDESTVCIPTNSYERVKLSLEEAVFEKASGKYECVIVRPTAVFGPGGLNVLKLARNLCNSTVSANYIRSCLFNKRRMNLVCVENVAAALEFFADAVVGTDRNVYLVSDDDEPGNDYGSIESRLMDLMGIERYPVSVVPLPKSILQSLLVVCGRKNAGVGRIYSSKKLFMSGFKKKTSLDAELVRFVEWYKRTQHASGVNGL